MPWEITGMGAVRCRVLMKLGTKNGGKMSKIGCDPADPPLFARGGNATAKPSYSSSFRCKALSSLFHVLDCFFVALAAQSLIFVREMLAICNIGRGNALRKKMTRE